MRKIFALLSVAAMAVSIVPTSVFAQSAESLAKIQALAHELKLTPQQEVKLLPILKEEAPKLEAIKNNPSMPGMQKMRELRAIHSQTAPEVQKILTPAQYQQLQAIREKSIQQAIARKRAGS